MMSKLLRRYQSLKVPIKASIWYMICNILQKGIAFLTTPIFTRLLSQSEFGVVNVYNSWLTIISIIATLELSTGVFNKAMVKFDDDRDGYTTSSLFLSFLASCVCLCVYIFSSSFWNKIFGLNIELVILIFIQIIFNTPVSLWSIKKRFEYQYRGVVVVTLLGSIGGSLLSVLLIILFPEYHIYARIFGGIIVSIGINIVISGVIIDKSKRFVSKTYWGYALKFNLPLLPHYLSQQILDQADRIMINSMCGIIDVALYSLAYQIASGMKIIINAVHASFVPWAFQRFQENNYSVIAKRAFQLELLIGLFCLIFSLFAPEIVLVLGGKDYYSAIYIIPPVAMSVVFITMYSFFGNVEFYFEKTTFTMIASMIVAITNILLNYIFIELFGYVAAGYTTLLCYLLYALVHYLFMIYVCKIENISNPFDGKLMWGFSIFVTLVSIFFSLLYPFVWQRYIVIAILTIVALVYIKKRKNMLFIK